MDRELKRLYRQRGSALRRVGKDVVIEDSRTAENAETQDVTEEAGIVDDTEPLQNFEEPAFDQGDLDGPPDIDIADHDVEEPSFEEQGGSFENYSFDELPITKFSTSITSMAAIEVFIAVTERLFGQHLCSQSEQNFHESKTRADRLSYKMDLKIFKEFAELVKSDLQDMLDIHLSNNDMCYQMKQILKIKQDLTGEIIRVRELISQYDTSQLRDAEKQQELESLISLNSKLKALKDIGPETTTP
ncbi:HHR136Cp [Eremothecium sinecaudum]|uniref:HHR136Cp n=1 Tax=Eremothecium sinecaudum TaxID=45286 RepID=A0A120K2X9_9SACH|nr:HHR136Cp [Eremothecium sinecaudum]AMD22905.1 HHR136Cp [Eremothecium sinecaudum]